MPNGIFFYYSYMINNEKILILGGTQMIGRDFVDACIDKNIYPIIANRNITNKNLFDKLNHISIDRNDINKCKNLNNTYFNIVIDFSCYNINQFLNTYTNINCSHYIFISTLCSFDNRVLNDSSHWLHGYCKNKKTVEDHIIQNNITDISIVRPCVIYGKYDYTNRFYEKNNQIYWKHNNILVKENKYYIPVRKFSHYLLEYVLSKNKDKIIHIDGTGTNIIK
jgi:dTDP-4-dehydrorhamnose reductase